MNRLQWIWLLVLAGCGAAAPSSRSSAAEAQPEQSSSSAAHATSAEGEHRMSLRPELRSYIERELLVGLESIPAERRERLLEIAEWARAELDARGQADLVFICTHNSRRSHIGQLWAHAAAEWFGVSGLRTHSGGTEATAFNPRAIAALERAGFEISPLGEGENPHYRVSLGQGLREIEAFSKTYDDASNPQAQFAAIMTCSQADESCPIVLGADFRTAVPYEDPKLADDTPEETARYDERVRQIGTEMFFLVSQIAERDAR